VLMGEVLCLGPVRVIVSALEPLPAQQLLGLLAWQFVVGLEFRSGGRAVEVVESYLRAGLCLGWLVRQVVERWLGAWFHWCGLAVQAVVAWLPRDGLARQVVEGWPGAWLYRCGLARQVVGG